MIPSASNTSGAVSRYRRSALNDSFSTLRRMANLLEGSRLEVFFLLKAKFLYFHKDSPEAEAEARQYVTRHYSRHPESISGFEEWRALHRDVVGSANLLQKKLEETRRLERAIEKQRDWFRNHLDILSRPLLRRLSILDLPNEVLAQIRERMNPDRWSTGKGIQNTRLVCWRFCELGSIC